MKSFSGLIGQQRIIKTLSFYLEVFNTSGRLPPLMLSTGKGGGKTFFSREFQKNMEHPKTKERPPLLEVNMASLKNAADFFNVVYPAWTQNNALLLADEFHNTPKDLQQIMLSILNVDEPVQTIQFGDESYIFDFTKRFLITATTDPQAIFEPLRDRFRTITFADYDENELYEIFKRNTPGLDTSEWKEYLIRVFRGNPRDAVIKAQNAMMFSKTRNKTQFSKFDWKDFTDATGILPFGLSESEARLLKILSRKKNGASLNALSSCTGMSRGAIQKDVEPMLLRKSFMEINVKRRATLKGLQAAKHLP